MNKFEKYLYSIKELKRVVKRLKFPQELTSKDLNFYEYLELKKIYIYIQKGLTNEMIDFEKEVLETEYSASKKIREINKYKKKKDDKNILRVHNAKTHVFHGNKKIAVN